MTVYFIKPEAELNCDRCHQEAETARRSTDGRVLLSYSKGPAPEHDPDIGDAQKFTHEEILEEMKKPEWNTGEGPNE